jgi:hypothetical protein
VHVLTGKATSRGALDPDDRVIGTAIPPEQRVRRR